MWKRVKRFATSPIGKTAGGMVLITGVILGWRFAVKPILNRRKRDQNEVFANFIFENRNPEIEDSVQQ